MTEADWHVLSEAFRILSPVLGGWAVYLLRQVLGQLRLLNGRMTRTETWQDEHNKQDDIQFDRINRELDLLQQRLHSQHQL